MYNNMMGEKERDGGVDTKREKKENWEILFI